MAADNNKVRFGLKNVHYSVRTVAGGSVTYATPVAIPGAVNLDITQEGSTDPFYADNIKYYIAQSNQGYTGSLEVARIPEDMLKDVWGFAVDTGKVIYEDVSVEPNAFALLFQIDGDASDRLYVAYNVSASRPNIGSATIEASKTPQTQTIDLTISPDEDGHTIAFTSEAATTGVTSTWFTTVYAIS